MKIEIHPDPAALAAAAADDLVERLRAAQDQRGTASVAVSGGNTPTAMFAALAQRDVDWDRVELFQVDERIAPDGDPGRNATTLRAELLDRVAIPAANVHLMGVTDDDVEAAAARYADTLVEVLGSPAVLDVVHLGIGDDGHTASWAPGDQVIDVTDRDVGLCGMFNGFRRMTLTPPAVNRARSVVFLVQGAAKAPMVARLVAGDRTIPAGHVETEHTVLLADRAATSELPGD